VIPFLHQVVYHNYFFVFSQHMTDILKLLR
jgi:hypothetical protein